MCAGTEENPGPQPLPEVESWEFQDLQDFPKTFTPTRTLCGVCGIGSVTNVARNESKGEMLVYTRNGIVKAYHPEFRCNSRSNSCRALHGLGYFKYQGKKIFEDDALKNEILVVTAQTAFTVEYMVEIVWDVEINCANFEGLAKKYNRFHNPLVPTATKAKREDLCRKRMADAYFLFA